MVYDEDTLVPFNSQFVGNIFVTVTIPIHTSSVQVTLSFMSKSFHLLQTSTTKTFGYLIKDSDYTFTPVARSGD